ncbi:MAG: hypothetical protein ABFS08_12540 [Pseudomonadota bacterium]
MRNLILCAVLFSPLASAEIYECMGTDGIMMYTERACTESEMDEKKVSKEVLQEGKEDGAISYEEIKMIVESDGVNE